MNLYIITYYDLTQIEVRIDTIAEAIMIANKVCDLEVIKVEKFLGV